MIDAIFIDYAATLLSPLMTTPLMMIFYHAADWLPLLSFRLLPLLRRFSP
jgi:hypothetical protein